MPVGVMFDATGGTKSEHFWFWFELVHGSVAVVAPGLTAEMVWALYGPEFEMHAGETAGRCHSVWDTDAGLLTVDCCGSTGVLSRRVVRRWADWSGVD